MIKRLCFMLFCILLWMAGMSVNSVINGAILILFVTYVVIPVTFYMSPYIQRHLIFLTFVNSPKKTSVCFPHTVGLHGTRNFYLSSEDKIKIGVWHILPEKLSRVAPTSNDITTDWYEHSLKNSSGVILYHHGNTASRAAAHRIELYNLLRQMDFHIFAFDYRGYADSSAVQPTEMGVVQDAIAVYKYILSKSENTPVIIWGHSLGTGVSSHVVRILCQINKPPTALILESPFNNIQDEFKFHPLTSIFRRMPKFDWFFLDSLSKSGIEFKSDEHIGHINIPVLILHAKDDLVVPYTLGERLYKTACKIRPKDFPPVKFVGFESEFGYGHKFIYKAPELPNIVRSIHPLAGYS